MSRLVHALNTAWGWTGVEFAEDVAHSLMGHVLAIDAQGIYHYVDPDILAVTRLGDEAAAQTHMASAETRAIWRADALVEAATQRLGFTALGEVYSRTLSAILSGDYEPENLVRIDLVDLIYLTGDLARQTRDLPDGARVQLKAT